jgi:hypothetical protein
MGQKLWIMERKLLASVHEPPDIPWSKLLAANTADIAGVATHTLSISGRCSPLESVVRRFVRRHCSTHPKHGPDRPGEHGEELAEGPIEQLAAAPSRHRDELPAEVPPRVL